MAYDGSSAVGDLICELYDEENNIMNPPSDAGWFFYNLNGKSFDFLYGRVNQLLLNLSPITCEDSYLDLFAKELKLTKDSSWSTEEWRAYIIIHYYNTMTVAGLEYVIEQIILVENDAESLDSDKSIKVSYTLPGFRFSSRFRDFELMSDRFVENDVITNETATVIQIEVPSEWNSELIRFIIEFLPYGAVLL